MKRKTSNRVLLTAALVLSSAVSTASAAPLHPIAPVTGGSALPTGQRCTVEALNVSGVVSASGSGFVANVPSNQGQVRLQATCVDAQGTVSRGQSLATVAVVPGGAVDVGEMSFTTSAPVAAKLTITPSSINLGGLGATQQLAVASAFADQTSGDATQASTGTVYRSSNLAVATVSPNGLVTAVGPGTAIVSATNGGAIGLRTVTVRSASLTSLSAIPASVALSINPAFPSRPAQLRVLGALSDGKTVDVTSASSGTTYSSSAPSIAAVSPDGAIIGVGNGSATITITDPQTGTTKQVPVTVSAFSPLPIAAYNTPGFAYNVEINGSLVFVADGNGGLQIYNAFSPTVIGNLAFVGQMVLDVRVRDTLAAVALGAGGFALVDVLDPTKPKALVVKTGVGTVRDLWLSGNRLYLASSTGLRVYDISNPAVPTEVGSVTGFSATAVAADSTRGLAVVLTTAPSVKVIQTASWSQATLSLSATTYPARDVALFGTSVYVANGLNQLREVDITNLAAPAYKSNSTLAQFTAMGVAVRQTPLGLLVAAADNQFVNAVPLFNARLNNTFNITFNQPVPPSYVPVQSDANGAGIALGDGFGVVAVGSAGIQVFRTQQITDNSGVPPTVSLNQPTGGGGLLSGQLATIHATATDDVGVSFVELVVDDNVVAVAGTAPFSGDFVPGAPCTTQVLKAQATDTNGNVAESLPVTVNVLCAEGQPCSTGGDCANNVCTAGICQAPCNLPDYPSCAALKAVCSTAPSGTRTLDPDGVGPVAPFQAYCDMDLDGGGWTLVAKMTNQDAKNWVNAKASWTGTTSYGDTTGLSAGQDAKSPAWGVLPASEMLLSDDASYASGNYISTFGGCIENTTMSQFFNDALASYPTLSGSDPDGQYFYKDCTTFKNYVPAWTYEPNYLLQDPNSPSNSLRKGYLTIAKTDNGATQAVISFYSHATILVGPTYLEGVDESYEYEADVGLAASELDGVAFGSSGLVQDIGGPSSCSAVDSTCMTQYPQTVFMFIR